MRRSVIVAIAVAIVGSGTAVVPSGSVALAATGAPTWSQPQAGTNPPDDSITTPVYDDATGQLLLTPGQVGTWTWDGGNWTQLHPANSPSPRLYQAVAYDGATKQVVLFGGDLSHATPVVASDGATDTWTWNGVNWTLQHPATAPPNGDRQICAAYDPATRQVLMYEIAALTGHSATWSWTGTNWVQLTVDAGPPMGSCSMAYDADQHTMLMLVNDGGLTVPGMQVWRWDGANWALTPMTMPIPTTYDMSMAYDADAGEMMAVVSAPTGPPPFIWPTSTWQTWGLAGSSWSQAAVTTPSDLAPLAFDAATHQVVSIEASADDPLPPIRTWLYGSATVSNVSPTRVSGADREATAVAVSQSAFPSNGTAPAVVLARADAFPDALAGGPLAAAKHGPLLLTSSASLDPVAKAEIQRVLKPGGTVYLLGGTAALSSSVSSAVSALGFGAVRLSGADRFGTAIAIAGALGNPGTVFEASGEGFADALSAVPAAVAQHGAIMLTDGTSQPAATLAYLKAHPGAHYAIGGAAAAADPSAIALVGADRYATSAEVARAFFPSATGVSTASGSSFPDALAGGAVAGAGGQPLLLVPPTGALPGPTAAYLQTRDGMVTGATVFGGLSAVGADVLTEVGATLDGNAVAA
jgi:putative cell wall-binding protein